MAQFARSFVNTPAHFPRRDIALRALIVAALAVMLMQPALALYPPGLRGAMHIAGWTIAVATAMLLPFVGFAATPPFGRHSWEIGTSAGRDKVGSAVLSIVCSVSFQIK